MTEIVAPILEAVLIEARDEITVIAAQQEAVTVEVRTEVAIIVPEPEAVIIEVRRGPVGPVGPPGYDGYIGRDGRDGETDFPPGTNTGDIIRYNAVTDAWESCAEPFEFKGIVLVPMALPGGVVEEGFVGYNIADKGIYVQID